MKNVIKYFVDKKTNLIIALLLLLAVLLCLVIGDESIAKAYEIRSGKPNPIFGQMEYKRHDAAYYQQQLRKAVIPLVWAVYMLFLCGMSVTANFRGSANAIKPKDIYGSLTFFLLVFIGGIALLWPAFYNKFPFYYPDTAAYIGGGGLDRSIGYNYFISLTTFRLSVWPVVFVQSLITSFLLLRASAIILNGIRCKEILVFLILMVVILLTDIAKYPSWLMPDIFTSWILLGGALFFLSPKWYDDMAGKNAIGLAMFCHNGNIFITILALILLSIIGYVYRLKIPAILPNIKKLVVYILLTLISISMLNYYSGRGFALFPPKKATFLMAKFISYGIVSKTLDRYCSTKKWELCKYADELKSLAGKSPNDIMWSEDYFYRKMKIMNNEKENEEILLYSFVPHVMEIMKYSIRDTFKLIMCFGTMDGLGKWNIAWAFQENFPRDVKHLIGGRQDHGWPAKVKIFSFNDYYLQIYIFFCACVAILLFLWKRKCCPIIIMSCTFLFIFINAFITGSISGPADRFNMRVLWLLPYSLFIAICLFIAKPTRANSPSAEDGHGQDSGR